MHAAGRPQARTARRVSAPGSGSALLPTKANRPVIKTKSWEDNDESTNSKSSASQLINQQPLSSTSTNCRNGPSHLVSSLERQWSASAADTYRLVTGTTSGIGKSLVLEIVARGDKVIATGRKVSERLASLKSDSVALLELDISSGREAIAAKVQEAWEVFGHIDVVVNNAGMSSMCTAEEASDAFINNMFTVNFFGPLHVTQAVLPLLRSRGSGVLAFTSSSTAWAPLPLMSHYAASKAALSAYVESLRTEVKPLGIQAVAFECGGFPTHLGQPRGEGAAGFGTQGTAIAAYRPMLNEIGTMFASDPMMYMPGDLAKVAPRMVDVIKGEGVAAGKPWAVRVLFGSDAVATVKQKCDQMSTLLESWRDVSHSTDRDGHPGGTTLQYLDFVSIL